VWGIYSAFTFRHPFLFGGVVTGAIALQVTGLVAPLYLRQFFNTLAGSSSSPAVVGELVGILTVVVGIWFLEWLMNRLRDTSAMHLQTRVMSDILTASFEYLLGHSYNFFVSRFSGSLTHKVNKFSKAYETMFDCVVLHFVPMVLFVGGASIILFFRHHVLGIALASWAVFFLAFQLYASYLRTPIRAERAAADSRVTANLADSISNQATIVLFSGASYEYGQFRETVETWRQALLRSWWADSVIWSGVGLLMLVIEGGLMFGALHYWKQGLLVIGDFVLIQAYLLATFDRLVTVNRELRRFFDAQADAHEMIEILGTLHEVSDVPGAMPLTVTKGDLQFKKVGFSFHEETAVFKNFNLHIKSHEKVALVGPSGAGKSTLTKLVLRLFDVKEGAIEIDGQNIAEVTQESLRNAISFVPQEPILFHRTLMENIRYGRRDATDEEVMEAAKKAYCHEFITGLTHGYDTYVGERGVKLSGGERQRVAIARAILKDSPILMLDEATSSLDSASEVLIQSALANLMSGKTVIVIAHRLSTIMKMDRIIALKDGRIAEEGTHQELLQKRGLYASLWSHQAGGFIKDE
jgi:ATP-binding cassette subfamily B protein